jgi:predicted dehydrogenase
VFEALRGLEGYRVAAVADQDAELAARLAKQCGAAAYNDYRSLIVESRLDVVYLCLPTYLCGECVHLAARQGMHVIKESPLARTLEEGVDWVRAMAKAGREFHVGSPRRFASVYQRAHELATGGELGEVYLVEAETLGWFGADLGWRGDPVLAGGGVLLERGSELVDQMTWSLGEPERAYALHTGKGAKRALPPYRTEDTATVLLRFGNGATGRLTASWLAGPARERLAFYGTERSVEIVNGRLRVLDEKGEVAEESRPRAVGQEELVARQMEHFAASLRDREIRAVSTAREHLVNVATVEAAYLSARTQLPEHLKQLK